MNCFEIPQQNICETLAISLKKMELSIPIVKIKLRLINLSILILMFLLLTILIFPFSNSFQSFVDKNRYLLGVLCVLSIISYWILPLIFKNYVEIGTLIFRNNSINILYENRSVEFKICDLKQIKFSYGDTASDGGRNIKFGINNYILLTDFCNKTEKYRLYLDNNKKVKLINSFLDNYKEQTLIVKSR